MKLFKAFAFFSICLVILVFVVNSNAQEVDPQQRMNQVNAQILRIDGMIEYNGLVRNEAAKAFATLTQQKEKLVATRDVLLKKIQEAKKAEEKPDLEEKETVTGIK